MSYTIHQRMTGVLLILGALLVNIPYTLLIVNFNYPDILREPAGVVLTQFQQGGTGLIFTWLGFAWAGLPLFFAIALLQPLLARPGTPYLWSGTVAGLIGAITQMIGLLRWPFVVPVLAGLYTDPTSSAGTKEAVTIVFQAIHQYGGVVIGEHIGQSFTILWMVIVSLALLRSPLVKPWLAWFGWLAALVYATAQTELLATVIPTFPVVPEAGLVGSLLWLAWMIALGIVLISTNSTKQEIYPS